MSSSRFFALPFEQSEITRLKIIPHTYRIHILMYIEFIPANYTDYVNSLIGNLKPAHGN